MSEPAGGPIKKELAKVFIDTVDPEDIELIDSLLQKAKTKPYHVVMRILLYVWSRKDRESVVKDLAKLKHVENEERSTLFVEMHHYSQLVWRDLNVRTYFDYINRHKSYVENGYNLFHRFIVSSVKTRLRRENCLPDEYEPQYDPTDQQIKVHDDSKYSFVELVTYAMRWYPLPGMGNCDEEAWETGLQHHYCHNEHHPEFWIEKNEPMKWRYLVEAIYDMVAMELEKKFDGTVPSDHSRLLQFDSQFLKRFDATGQLPLVQKLVKYTTEAYNRELAN